jgi:aminobenzoyl-glutamate transport protein
MPDANAAPATNGNNSNAPRGLMARFLNAVEWAGNKLPDPAMLFVWCLLITWLLSWGLSYVEFSEIDPRTVGKGKTPQAIQIQNQLEWDNFWAFFTKLEKTFTGFHPLGVVLVALLGVGVAEHTGFINSCLKGMLAFTPRHLLSPMLLTVAIISHTAGDTGYVLVIPLGGVIFYAAGRHPVAGTVCAFAGVSGGFSANFIVSGLDPLLQGLTQQSAQLLDPKLEVNPLCNYFFTAVSSVLIIGVGWFLTDRVIEPRLKGTAIDGDPADMPKMDPLTDAERFGLAWGLSSLAAGLALLIPLYLLSAPLIKAVVPLIFVLFLLPGVVYGYAAGTVKSHRDIIKGMSKSMSTMGYYLVMAFFAAQFIEAFNASNLGALLAIKGAGVLRELQMPAMATIIGIILIATMVNLLIGSASAKWALLGPIFVPMLMQLGMSPELTQAAYRVGDSSTNIITPMMPYFPLIVVYCQRYVKGTGIGTLIALMLPFSVCFLITWTALLMGFMWLDIPLGLAPDGGPASYTYSPGK